MTERDYNRRPTTLLEVTQPRCNKVWAQIFTDNLPSVPTLEAAKYVSISSSAVDRTADFTVVLDVTFDAEPSGCIFELGGTGIGAYLGVTSGELVWRAGSGADVNPTPNANTAFVRTDATPFADKRFVLVATVNVSEASVRLRAYELPGVSLVLDVSHTASGSLATWAGTDNGMVGRSTGGIPIGENSADWNGQIVRDARLYSATLAPEDLGFRACGADPTGTPCYNTRTTCRADLDYNSTDATLTWRFCRPEDEALWRGIGGVDGQHVKLPALPCLDGVSTSPTKLNVGAARDGESPFGVRSKLNASLLNIPWADPWDDPYATLRTQSPRGTLFPKLRARNEFLSGWKVRLYEGYYGQTLDEMQNRLFLPSRLDGPSSQGTVTLTANDPLQLTDDKRALFPRPTPIILDSAIDASQTSDILVLSSAEDLTDSFGNTTEKYIRSGNEIFTYTGTTLENADTGLYRLTGVTRGVLGTTGEAHDENDTLQRVGRYESMPFWEVQYDLLDNHTPADLDANEYIDLAQWAAEGNQFLGIFRATGTVPEPTPVVDLSGELNQQGLFSIWWDERTQKIPLRAVRPVADDTIVDLDETRNILDGAVLKDAPEERLTRVFLRYSVRNPLNLRDPGNFARGALRAEFDLEQPELGGQVLTKQIFARWIREDALAIQFTRRLLARYLSTPRYLTFSLDAKDRAVTVGTVVRITSGAVEDEDGNVRPVLWQVISENEVKPGETVVYDAQTFTFVGRFATYMADGSATYLDTPEGLREVGAWYAGDNGKMSNGDDGFQYQ